MEKTALLVIDLQQGLGELHNLASLLEKVNTRIAFYRAQQLPIIFIQHEDDELSKGSVAWQLFPALDAQKHDYYVGKKHANSFYKTELTALLTQLNVTSLEFCGAQTEYCVDTTIRMAHGLGYQNQMLRGLSTTKANQHWSAAEIITHHEQLWDRRFLTFLA